MNEVPQWASFATALIVPAIAILGFWMSLSSRLTKAEVVALEAEADAKEANEKATLLSASFALYREQIAREYIHREVMREVEDRLTQAIERLGDRLDRVLERSGFTFPEMTRAVVVVATLLLSSPSHAVPCWVVKKAVAQYGEAAVESWARAKGIPDKEIEKARRCLR